MKFTVSYMLRYDRVVEAENIAQAGIALHRFAGESAFGKVVPLSVYPVGAETVEPGGVVEGEKKL